MQKNPSGTPSRMFATKSDRENTSPAKVMCVQNVDHATSSVMSRKSSGTRLP